MKLRNLLLVPVLAVALALPGCTAFKNFANLATTTITNPVRTVDIYRVNNVYAGAQALVLEYQERCFQKQGVKVTLAQIKSDSVLKDICRRRVSRYQAMKAMDNKAYVAIRTAENFIANNPSGNAASYIAAAWAAVNEFQAQVSK